MTIVLSTSTRLSSACFDILAALKDGDSCCWRHYLAAHFTGEAGVSRPEGRGLPRTRSVEMIPAGGETHFCHRLIFHNEPPRDCFAFRCVSSKCLFFRKLPERFPAWITLGDNVIAFQTTAGRKGRYGRDGTSERSPATCAGCPLGGRGGPDSESDKGQAAAKESLINICLPIHYGANEEVEASRLSTAANKRPL